MTFGTSGIKQANTSSCSSRQSISAHRPKCAGLELGLGVSWRHNGRKRTQWRQETSLLACLRRIWNTNIFFIAFSVIAVRSQQCGDVAYVLITSCDEVMRDVMDNVLSCAWIHALLKLANKMNLISVTSYQYIYIYIYIAKCCPSSNWSVTPWRR